jgi:hypothetical protein
MSRISKRVRSLRTDWLGLNLVESRLLLVSLRLRREGTVDIPEGQHIPP